MKEVSRKGAEQRMKDMLEFLESAKDNLKKQRFKVCVDNAVDAVIAANDAFTIFLLGQVATGDHQEAVRIHREAGRKIGGNQYFLLQHLLEERHKKTYRAVSVSKKDAEEILEKSIKFMSFVQKNINI